MNRLKLFSYRGYTTLFNRQGLYKYNLVIVNGERYLKSFSSFNNNYIISNQPLPVNVKLSDAIKYKVDVIWCNSINEILIK